MTQFSKVISCFNKCNFIYLYCFIKCKPNDDSFRFETCCYNNCQNKV